MINDILKNIPEMMTKDELYKRLIKVPVYNKDICKKGSAERLVALMDIYDTYVPSDMTYEIYSKLYLAMLNSMKKKCTASVMSQVTENTNAIRGITCRGILGGSDSFTIIGKSGIGKSTAIYKAIGQIMKEQIIEIDLPYIKIVPYLVVQCPFDASVKGLLLEILRQTDIILGTRYYENAVRARATTDMLIGSVSQTALNHIGVLIVDEIQNITASRNGNLLIGVLTQLINNSGISICMVGTPKCKLIFEKEMQLARRSVGLEYGEMAYDIHFYELCHILFEYQYTIEVGKLSDELVRWLYEHSGGLISVVVSLVHDAQEIGILSGTERLDIQTLNLAYEKRLSMLKMHIKSEAVKMGKTKKSTKVIPEIQLFNHSVSITELAEKAKNENAELLSLLKNSFSVSEVVL